MKQKVVFTEQVVTDTQSMTKATVATIKASGGKTTLPSDADLEGVRAF